MVCKLAFNDQSDQLKELLKEYCDLMNISFEAYSEDSFKERKKAFKLKGGYGAKMVPFAVLINETPIKAFYSEANECYLDNIISFIKSINYGN